jgi:hypothetical protein
VSEVTNQSSFTWAASVFAATKLGTAKTTFTTGKIGAATLFSRELVEDAGFNVVDAFAQEYVRAIAAGIDAVLLSGDESATATNIAHYGVDPTGTAYDYYMACDGLRHIAFANSDTVAHATISADSPATIAALMGARGIIGRDVSNLALICDPGVAYKFDALADYESLADVGPQATLLTGQVGQCKGVPIIVSDELENTEANGRILSTHNSALGSFLVVHRGLNKIGRRRDVGIESEAVRSADGYALFSSVRFDIQSMQAGSVAYGFNTTV